MSSVSHGLESTVDECKPAKTTFGTQYLAFKLLPADKTHLANCKCAFQCAITHSRNQVVSIKRRKRVASDGFLITTMFGLYVEY